MNIKNAPGAFTPESARTVWIASNAGLLLVVPIYTLWLKRVLSGELPPSSPDVGDVPTVAIFGIAVLVVVAAPILNFGLYLLLRSYPGRISIFARLQMRGWMLLGEIVRGAIAGAIVLGLVNTALAGDWELSAVFLWWFIMILWYRAIAIEKHLRKRQSTIAGSPTLERYS